MRKNLTVCVLQKKEKGKKKEEKKIKVRLIVTMAYSRKGTRKGKKAGKKFYVVPSRETSSGNFKNITLS